MKKKVVVIGGGNGSATVNNALKTCIDEVTITSIVSVSDSGGANGRLRKQLNQLPSADILRAILALSPYEYKMLKKIFRTNRFSTGAFEGHYLGNVFLMLTATHTGDYLGTIKALEDAVEAVGKVYPATLEQSDLCAELSDGKILIGEGEIDRPSQKDRAKRITRAWLQPTPQILPEAKEAIEQAEYIILAPGSLYTSLIATLVVEGMKKGAIRNSNAKIIYIAGNAYEKNGEPGPTVLSEVVAELEQYLPRPTDVVICNNHHLSDEEKAIYKKKEWGILELDTQNMGDKKVIQKDFEKEVGGLDPEKIGAILREIIQS